MIHERKFSDAFDGYMEWLLLAEGPYADDRNDRGGITTWGLSSQTLRSIGWSGDTPTREQAIEIYRQYYWDGWRCDEMHPMVAWCACDAYVQHPPKAAALMIQQGLGVTLDGKVGPKTIEAAQSPNLLLFWRRYRLARVRYYNDILANDDTQKDFIDGWQERMHMLIEGLYFAGMVKSDKEGTGLVATITSPGAKATGAGLTLGGLVVALQSVGLDTADVAQWAREALPAGGLIGVIAAWLARNTFKGD